MNEPRFLFFTGGSAMRGLSQKMARRKLFSIHAITTFDSGGSTGALRRAFAIPAVGDLRNRLLALANRDLVPDSVIAFCDWRLPDSGSKEAALGQLRDMGRFNHSAWQEMPEAFARPLWLNFQHFLHHLRPGFDARGANLGNLILAGSYLEHKGSFAPILALLGELLAINGIVIPIVNANLNLGARLKNGEIIVGQHNFNKHKGQIDWIFLTVHESAVDYAQTSPPRPIFCRPPILAEVSSYIKSASLVCYPMGSFYSSVLANLLPSGCGRAIAESKALKVFIPNSGLDAESSHLSLVDQAEIILKSLREDAPSASNEQLMRVVLVDKNHGQYPGGIDATVEEGLARFGLRVQHQDMIHENNPQRHDSEALLDALCRINPS